MGIHWSGRQRSLGGGGGATVRGVAESGTTQHPCKIGIHRAFPGGLLVKIPGFHCHGLGLTPGWGTEILQAKQCGQKLNK